MTVCLHGRIYQKYSQRKYPCNCCPDVCVYWRLYSSLGQSEFWQSYYQKLNLYSLLKNLKMNRLQATIRDLAGSGQLTRLPLCQPKCNCSVCFPIPVADVISGSKHFYFLLLLFERPVWSLVVHSSEGPKIYWSHQPIRDF